ncbi:hypothetical protein GCM10007858_60990 [Bradyrhizobium liaoningense]|nr:hypothetical protein GCM10007858_60990 [Bradyrhizobium liaoningense]
MSGRRVLTPPERKTSSSSVTMKLFFSGSSQLMIGIVGEYRFPSMNSVTVIPKVNAP